ncbi:MAG TPA: hypothetical protein VMH04_05385 [Candidatus Solibacter sp.]|nr:hypothetical protein [Candidatus Solibacter sp.]
MSLRSRFVLPVIALLSLAFLAGCGGGTHSAVAPPSGGFTNSNFNGTYTFSTAGSDANGIFAMAGTLTACGCAQGTISGGTVDLVDPTGPAPGSTIGNSTYKVSADGRGTARLFITTTSSLSLEVDLDFVLISSSHALITRYDGSGTGSGTMDLQSSSVTQASLAAPFAFSLSGSDLANNPLSTVGAVTLDSTGNVTTGVEDFNYSATPSTQLTVTGSVQIGSGAAPGNATLSTSFGTFTFSVYTIDSTHLKLIENDGQAIMVGDVLSQPSTSFPSGSLVFTMSNIDLTGNLIAIGGIMSSDGTSTIPSGSADINDAGLVDNGTTTPFSFSGSFASTGGGRYTVNMSNFVGGTQFVAYPSSAGLLMLETDTGLNAGVAGGMALTQQSGAAIAASSGYGLNLSGEDVFNQVEFDEIAEFTTTSTSMKGLIDQNDGGSLGTSNFNGTYAAGSDGLGSATFNAGFAGMFYYAADSSTILFISTDSSQAALGSFETQVKPTSASLAAARIARPRPMSRVLPRLHSAMRRGAHHIGETK